MQEIMCSLCAGSAEMVIADGLTYTICGSCANIHIAETNQYIKFDVSNAESMALVPRKLFVVALAMQVVYTVYDEIYREVRKKFNVDVPLSE